MFWNCHSTRLKHKLRNKPSLCFLWSRGRLWSLSQGHRNKLNEKPVQELLCLEIQTWKTPFWFQRGTESEKLLSRNETLFLRVVIYSLKWSVIISWNYHLRWIKIARLNTFLLSARTLTQSNIPSCSRRCRRYKGLCRTLHLPGSSSLVTNIKSV